MKRIGWWVLGLGVLVAAVTAGVYVAGRHAKEQRLAAYRYVVPPETSAAAANTAYRQVTTLDPGVTSPHALAVDSAGRIVVAGDDRLAVLTRDGIVLHEVPLDEPAWCLGTDASNRIYVGHARTVGVRDRDGQPRAAWMSFGENARLASLAIYGNDVFVADAGQRTVWRMDTAGRLRGRIEGQGFKVPSPYFDVHADDEGLWIVNPGRLRVERYKADGTFVSAWGKSGMGMDGFCGCCNPIQLARLASGDFVTAEKGLARVKVMDPEGNLQAVVADRHAFASGDLAPNAPAHIADLAVDAEGRVLVLDRRSGQIKVFVEK